MNSRLVLIDANSLLHRAYHALPPLTTSKGEQVGAVFGFTSTLLKVFQELKPEYVIVAWDTKEPTFRHQEYTQYKAHRPEADPDLIEQFSRTHELVSAFSIPQYEVSGYEADDIIGTLAKRAADEEQRAKSKEQKDLETIIVTGDLDTLQLIDEKTKVYTPRRGFSDTVLYDEKLVTERYGLVPSQIVDYKALRGDPSDNIPGVKGIGEKTAAELLQKFRSLGEVYKHLDKVSARQKKLLSEGQENAFLSRGLAEIKKDVPIMIDLEKCKLASYDRKKVLQLFQELEFRSLIGKLPESDGKIQE
ncbi:MAG: DNA polymerase I, partial [Candidatus Cloacimonetes bacterium]|nr:DNA polymerase I [Candidatus Cloacimonadota bacterium]